MQFFTVDTCGTVTKSLILSIWTDENLKSAFNPFLSTLRQESGWFYLLQYELLVHTDNVLSAAIFSVNLILHALRHQLHWIWCKNISWVLHYNHCEYQGKTLLSSQIYYLFYYFCFCVYSEASEIPSYLRMGSCI